MDVIVDRIVGSFIGHAVGDAMGLIVEGHDCEIAISFLESFAEDRAAGTLMVEFGQYSDDTQLARELSCSLIARRCFDPTDYAFRICDLFMSGRVVGGGRTLHAAAQRLASGVHWSDAGAPAGAAGNGAAMRATPIGWLFGASSQELVNAASIQAMITHRDSNAVAGSIVMAQAVAINIRDGINIEGAEFLEQISAVISNLAPAFANMIFDMRHFLELPQQQVHSIISQMGSSTFDDEWRGTISPHVVPSVLWALFSYLRGRSNFFEVVKIAISGGGDTDTTAAMGGALAGAALGQSCIPKDLAIRINDHSHWGIEELSKLASDIACLRTEFWAQGA
jgi:ADP-ribosylglycohydrolase